MKRRKNHRGVRTIRVQAGTHGGHDRYEVEFDDNGDVDRVTLEGLDQLRGFLRRLMEANPDAIVLTDRMSAGPRQAATGGHHYAVIIDRPPHLAGNRAFATSEEMRSFLLGDVGARAAFAPVVAAGGGRAPNPEVRVTTRTGEGYVVEHPEHGRLTFDDLDHLGVWMTQTSLGNPDSRFIGRVVAAGPLLSGGYGYMRIVEPRRLIGKKYQDPKAFARSLRTEAYRIAHPVDDMNPRTSNTTSLDQRTGDALEDFVRHFRNRSVDWDGFVTKTMMFYGEESDDPAREWFQRMFWGGAVESAGRNRHGESMYRLTPAAKDELVRRGVWFASHGQAAAPRQTNRRRRRNRTLDDIAQEVYEMAREGRGIFADEDLTSCAHVLRAAVIILGDDDEHLSTGDRVELLNELLEKNTCYHSGEDLVEGMRTFMDNEDGIDSNDLDDLTVHLFYWLGHQMMEQERAGGSASKTKAPTVRDESITVINQHRQRLGQPKLTAEEFISLGFTPGELDDMAQRIRTEGRMSNAKAVGRHSTAASSTALSRRLKSL